MKDLIIHHIYWQWGEWRIAYEFKGEWKPTTKPVMEFLKEYCK